MNTISLVIKYLKIILKTAHAVVYYFLTLIMPKDNSLWVFGCWKGRNYSDNSRSLFEYVNTYHKNIKAVWIAKNSDVYNEVKGKGFNVELYPSIKSRWIVARAGVNIQTESNEDTGRFRVGGTKIIQLFHGYGAIKETPLFAGMNNIKKWIVQLYADDHSKSYWMVPSEYFVRRYPILCGCDAKKMFITGQPRIDLLLSKKKNQFFEDFVANHDHSKLIIYSPTHRNYGMNSTSTALESIWAPINECMKDNNSYLFFKPHPLELPNFIGQFHEYSNIILISDKTDVYEYLHYFDMLISDYSSISADYLVMNRPIIHFMYDLDTFVTEKANINALSYFTAGPICKTVSELVNQINTCLRDDTFENVRKKAASIAFKYIDTNNCKRVYETILNKVLNP